MTSIMIVGVVDLVQGALAAALAHEGDLEVVSEPPLRADDVIEAARAHRPAVVIVDLDRYGLDGLDTVRRLADEALECRALLLTSQRATPMLRRVLAADVWGLASTDMSPDQLAHVIRQVAGGERFIDPALAAAALRPDTLLTGRERAVLRLAGEGLRSGEIAERLFLSPGTVRNYLSAAVRKTGARNRLEAVRRAQEAGCI